MSSSPQLKPSDKFNPALFDANTDIFTLASADVRYVRIGSDAYLNAVQCSSLTINGVLADLSFITGITVGTAQASKAVVLNGSRNISNINNIGSTGLISNSFTNNSATLQTYQSWTNTSTIPVIAEMDISNVGASIGTTTSHPFRLISNNTERVRVNATTGNVSIGNTFDTYKLDVSGATMTTSLKIREMGGGGSTNAPSFTIENSNGSGFTGGLRISADSQNLLNVSNIGFWSPAFNTLIMYLSSTSQNCVHMRPQSGADVNVNMLNTGLCCGNNAIVRGGLIVSGMPLTNTNNTNPQTKLRVIGDTDYVDGSYQKVAEFCNSLYGNTLSIQCSTTLGGPIYLGGLNGSDLRFGTSNSTTMMLTDTGHLLIGTTSDVAPLVVSGSSTLTISSITTTSYRYNVSSNSWTNLGTGPVSFSISAYFSSNIFVQNSVYTTSDRRLKDDIKPLDITLDHYEKLKPVSYRYRNETNTKLGLLAQDVMKVCSEMVGYSENEKMKKETEDDIEGYQYTVDYSQLSVMNTVAIKKLIAELKELRSIVEKLTSKPALDKWLKKN